MNNVEITKLKSKNQLTVPVSVVKKLKLKPNELFQVEIEGNCIRLIPVDIEPRYNDNELYSIDSIVTKEKGRAKKLRPGKSFSHYIKELTK